MDLRPSPACEAFRGRVRAFLDDHLPADWVGAGALSGDKYDRFLEGWRRLLVEERLLAVTWPTEYGGAGLGPEEQIVLSEEFAAAGVPAGGRSDIISVQLLGNTVLRRGTEEQKRRLLPRILSGEDVWCQGYSEPDAGSDLANIALRAVRDGDDWVLDGQKLWTSYAQFANWAFVLGRTDATGPKHAGITFFLVPMDQPGISIRPVRTMNGDAEFNEVFFDGARTAADNIVGEPGRGWSVAMTLLGFERGEAAATMPIRLRTELDRLMAMVRARGLADDPLIRGRVADCYVRVEALRALGLRSVTRFLAGESPGPEAGLFKLAWSEIHQRMTLLAVDVLGAAAMAPSGRRPPNPFGPDEPGAPNDSAEWVGLLLNSRAASIYAGTSEIQRNIVGELLLGLPKEPVTTGRPA